MSGLRKPYRIEQGGRPSTAAEIPSGQHAEIMAAFADLRALVQPATEVSQAILEEQRRDLKEAQELKAELDAISAAIQRTKEEIATLHYAGSQGREMSRVTDELGAVVNGTEGATHTILEAAEAIDDLSSNLSARLNGDDRAIAGEIAERVVLIFEACNFQDITGQRISKVVNTMRFIEERVGRMITIWGGLEGFNDVEVQPDPSRAGDRALLNGPALTCDAGLTSQDDIDALFG